MGSFATYAANKILDHITGKTSFTMPTHAWVALWVGDPGDAGSGGAEVSGGSYARVETAGTDWAAASARATSNAAAISFAEATGDWGTVTHFALMDALTSGNMLAHGALTTGKAITTGDTASFAIGDLDLSVAADA